MFKTKPTPEQVAALLAAPTTDPDEAMRRRLAKELRRIVNHAALFGLEAPAPEATERARIRASLGGTLPKAIRLHLAAEFGKVDPVNPYDTLERRIHGGVWKGD